MKHISKTNLVIAGFALISFAYYIQLTVGELGRTQFDDAYMVTRYAKHWLNGDGFSWNAVDGPAYGITSPAYLIVITAVLGLVGCPDAMALTITSFVAGLLSVLTLVLLGFLIQKNCWSKKSWIPLLVVPSFLFVPPFRAHSLTGMETTLSLLSNAILACTMVIATRQRSTQVLWVCLLAGFFSFATRPDNGLYALFLPPLFFIATDRQLWRYAIRYAVLFAAIIASSLLMNYFVFNDFLPLPFFAKAKGFYQGYLGATSWNPMKEMLIFGSAALPCLLVIVSKVSKQSLAPVLAIIVVGIASFAYYATVIQIMGFYARYYYPSMAFVVFAAFIAVFGSVESMPIKSSGNAVGLRLLAGLLVLLSILSSGIKNTAIQLWEKHAITAPTVIQSFTQYRKPQAVQLPRLGWWDIFSKICDLLEQVPRGIVFAASEYGFIGTCFPDLTIIDLVGLHDRVIAHHGFSAAYVFSRKPDLIWFPHPDYTGAVAQILDDPTFRRSYAYYPGAYEFGIALRKDSEHYAALKVATEREFARIYPGLTMSNYLAEPIAAFEKK